MWFYPKIIAHRGGGTLAPENTIAALRCGLSYGFRAVEFDVMLSADGIPVLMHDPHFGRTVHAQGQVAQTSAAELGRFDAGSWFGAGFAGEPVPTYEQAVHFCKTNGIWMNVEIKPAPGHEAETGRIVGDVTRRLFAEEIAIAENDGKPHDPSGLPLFSSFSFDALMQAARAAPAIPRGFLLDAILPGWHEQLKALEAVALHTNHRKLSHRQAAEVKQAGYGLFCYTVNDPPRARELLEWGVDAFCTDRIDLIGPDFAG
ncbi:glycerophosphodiester phosphodiesterase [Noviherbaspirillum aerium]|uniref:glycerophosphodiester phosphodiesterase n=1 Tax=Noviherbaspirillum aerium TaxID=2588497 RepID=UPI00124DD32F|nr:glycerophosphodiester phosphodiesterase [Noviherbaspirillum aerium]